MYEIQLFGPLEVATRGVRLTARDLGVGPRQVLALLALRGAMSTAELVEALWAGRPPADPVRVLERHVAMLRRQLDPEASGRRSAVLSRRDGYDLDSDQVRTDVARFDELLAAAAWRTPDRALPPLTAAAHLAGRPLLAGESSRGWVLRARHLYHGRLVESLLRVGERALAAGLPGTAAELAARALAVTPQVGTAAYRAMTVGATLPN